MKRLGLYTAIMICAAVLLLNCGPSSRQNQLSVAGSTTVLPVVSKCAEQYMEAHPDADIVVNAGGSGTGINLLGEGEIDIGMSSRALSSAEKNQYDGVDFKKHVVGLDAVLPVVSDEIYEAGVQHLTREEIAGIYGGDITNWSEVGGPDREIFVVDKEPSRGTRHVFMSFVFDDSGASAPGADVVLGANNEEQNAIANSNAAIGMLSRPWLSEQVKGLGIEREDGAVVRPTEKRIRKRTYPIMRELRLFTDGRPEGLAKSFIEFLKGEDGQKIVRESGYVPVN